MTDSRKDIGSPALDPAGKKDADVISKDKQEEIPNEYINLLTKKIRATRKKVTKITEIEEKVSAGKNINPDQKELLADKSRTYKLLKDYEELRSQFSSIYTQKQAKRHQKRTGDEATRRIVELLQIVNHLNSSPETLQALLATQAQNKASGKNAQINENDINRLTSFAALITGSQGVGFQQAFQHARNFVYDSPSEAFPGVTYKRLATHSREAATVLFAQAAPTTTEAPAPQAEPLGQQSPVQPQLEVQPSEAQVQQQEQPAPAPTPAPVQAQEPLPPQAMPEQTQQEDQQVPQPNGVHEARDLQQVQAEGFEGERGRGRGPRGFRGRGRRNRAGPRGEGNGGGSGGEAAAGASRGPEGGRGRFGGRRGGGGRGRGRGGPFQGGQGQRPRGGGPRPSQQQVQGHVQSSQTHATA
jgi:hypothetical protein